MDFQAQRVKKLSGAVDSYVPTILCETVQGEARPQAQCPAARRQAGAEVQARFVES